MSVTDRPRWLLSTASFLLACFLALILTPGVPTPSGPGQGLVRIAQADDRATEPVTPSVPTIRVRTGEHGRFSRIVFDWTTFVDYWLQRDIGRATVVFERPASFDLSRLGPRPARWIDDIRTENRRDGVEVHLDVPTGAQVRHLRVGPKVVVDVYRPGATSRGAVGTAVNPGSVAAEQAPPDPADADEAADGTGTDADPVPPEAAPEAEDKPEPAVSSDEMGGGDSGEARAEENTDTASEDVATESVSERVSGSSGDEMVAIDPAADAGASPADAPNEGADNASEDDASAPPAGPMQQHSADEQEPTATTRSATLEGTGQAADEAGDRDADERARDDQRLQRDRPVFAEPLPARGPPSDLGANDEATPQISSPGGAAAAADRLVASGTLRFRWRAPTAAAVFRRGGWIWIVFDRASQQDTAALASAVGVAKGQLQQLEPSEGEEATVLRIAPGEGVQPTVERDGLTWLITFAPPPRSPDSSGVPAGQPLEPQVDMDSPVGPRLVFSAEDAASPVTIDDPEIGDRIFAVPVLPPGHRVIHAYEYPQLRVLATAQGLAIDPRIEGLDVRKLASGVEVTSPAGLEISPVPEEARIRARLGLWSHLSRILPEHTWPEPSGGDVFASRERALRDTAAASSGDERAEALLGVAQFYLAHGLATECAGALKLAADEQESLADDPRYRLIRGMCRFIEGDVEAARKDLDLANREGSDEGALWQATLQAISGDREAAAETLLRTGALSQSYPPALRAPLMEVITDSAIAAGDARAAQRYVDALRLEPEEHVAAGEVAVLEGALSALRDDPDAALAKWSEAIVGDNRRSSAVASRAAIELKLNEGDMTAGEAIEALESLRHAWRGDSFEFDLLRRLGELYEEQGNQRQALLTWRQAATHFPDHPEVGLVSEAMSRIFEELYLHGGADALPPMTAIALFDEFRELTPAGDRGNEMIRKLADRLVAVDLLDRAEKLLQDQVDHRLSGVDKARVGARLGLVYLLDHEPQATLDALDGSDVPVIPAELERQRRQLRARALSELERFDDALDLLADDDSSDADLIRADVYWQQKDWRRAGQVLARLAARAGARPGQPLDELQARYVINRAVALALDGDENGLARLRRGYREAMEASPWSNAFRLIAGAEFESATDLRALVSADVSEAEGFQAFLAAYRDRLREGSLSAIN